MDSGVTVGLKDDKIRYNEEQNDQEGREYEKALDEEIESLERGLRRKEIEERLGKDCVCCGPPVENKVEEMCLLGLDVVALFPSMSASIEKSVFTGNSIRAVV